MPHRVLLRAASRVERVEAWTAFVLSSLMMSPPTGLTVSRKLSELHGCPCFRASSLCSQGADLALLASPPSTRFIAACPGHYILLSTSNLTAWRLQTFNAVNSLCRILSDAQEGLE